MTKFIIPNCKPVTVNQAYAIVRGRKIKTKKAREFEKFVINSINVFHKKELSELKKTLEKDNPIELTYKIYNSKVLTKQGKLSRIFIDIDNSSKVLTDSIFKALELDDYIITRLIIEKIQHEHDFIEVNIRSI